MLLLALQSACY